MTTGNKTAGADLMLDLDREIRAEIDRRRHDPRGEGVSKFRAFCPRPHLQAHTRRRETGTEKFCPVGIRATTSGGGDSRRLSKSVAATSVPGEAKVTT